MHRVRRPALLALTGLAAALAATGAGLVGAGPATSAVARTAAAPAWTSVWRDDFSGSGRLSSQWLYRLGTSVPGGPAAFGTGEVEVNTDSTANVTQSAGALHIKALRDSAGGWTSGRVETVRDDFQPPAGGVLAVESRLQLPNLTGAAAAGYWPAFWMLGTPYRANAWSWPGIGEIDIMENVQGLNTVWGTVHCGTAPGGECHENDGLGGTAPGGTPSLQAAPHTYRIEWDRSAAPEQVRWYLDGRLFHTVSQNQVSAATWTAAFGHPFYLIYDLAIGGAFPAAFGGGPTAATASGGELVIDYVAVSSRAGTATSPSPTPTPTPTPTSGTTVSARSTIQAEAFAAQSGAGTEPTSDTGGGTDVGWLANGDWLRYDRVDFGATPVRTFSARSASGAAGGVSGLVEVRLDAVTGPVLGSFAIANTGGWQSWRTVPANVAGITGVHTLYLTFTSGQPADFVNLNWFTFS